MDVAQRVRDICLALPGTTERLSHGAPAFFVRRQFAVVWADGHPQHRFPHLWCAAEPGTQEALLATGSDRWFRPPYVGHRGWVGVRLDGEAVDWQQVAELLAEGHRHATAR